MYIVAVHEKKLYKVTPKSNRKNGNVAHDHTSFKCERRGTKQEDVSFSWSWWNLQGEGPGISLPDDLSLSLD